MKNKKIIEKAFSMLVWVVLFSLFGTAGVFAQKVSVAGKITDSGGETIVGASVLEKGTVNAAISNVDGAYSITVSSPDAVLVFSFVGMLKQEIAVGGKSTVNVIMVEDAIGLEDVVVVGYGTQKRVNLTGAVGVVSSNVLENRPVASTYQALQGVMAGLNVTVSGNSAELGGTMNINVRGHTSINGGGPLILVDGVKASVEVVNPSEIESVTVLKDQASAAIYGAQAAYGVVMITTKSGSPNKVQIDYSTNLAMRSPVVLPKNMSSLEFATMFNTATKNDNVANLFSDDDVARIKAYLNDPKNTPVAIPNPSNTNVWGKHNFSNANTDWYSTIYKQYVFDQNHNLAVRGGSDNIKYSISSTFIQQDGLLNYGDQGLERYMINANLDTKLNSWLSANVDAKYQRQDIERPTFAKSDLYSDLSLRWPNNYVKDPNGYYSNFSEVKKLLEGGMHYEKRDLYSTRVGLNIEPIKHWITNVSMTQSNNQGNTEETDIPVYEYGVDLTPVNVTGVSSYLASSYKIANTTAAAFSTYEKQLSSHYFKVMGGWQYEYQKYSTVSGRRQNLIVNSIASLSSASGEQFATDNKYEYALNSFFGRLNYNYEGKYLLEINARADGSSRFPADSRYGFFPSVSAGYAISEENYWNSMRDIINFLKLRVSYGKLGNQNVSPDLNQTNPTYYPYVSVMPINLSSTWLFADNSRIAVGSPGLVAPNLTWETVRGWNVGLTANTLNRRLSVDADVYRRITENMFGPASSFPAILGAAAPRINSATMATNGYEILLQWKDKIDKFNYTISASLADYRGKILKYNNPTMLNNTYYEGMYYGNIWGYVTEGLFQTLEEVEGAADQNAISSQLWKPGDVRYKDLNGDGKINYGTNTVTDPGDRKVIGNTTPRYSYSFTFYANYKNIDFNMFWQGIGKRDLWISNSLFWGMAGGQWSSGGFTPHTDYWTEDNPDAYFPRPLWTTFAKNTQTQTRYLSDASYLRLKSIQLGYAIPTNGKFIKNCRIYIVGENVLTFKKILETFDPEIENNGLSYPLQKAWSVGLNVSF